MKQLEFGGTGAATFRRLADWGRRFCSFASMSRLDFIVGLIASSILMTYMQQRIELWPEDADTKALWELSVVVWGIVVLVFLSVKRAKDAGQSAWVGWLILVPGAILVILPYLLIAPSRKRDDAPSSRGFQLGRIEYGFALFAFALAILVAWLGSLNPGIGDGVRGFLAALAWVGWMGLAMARASNAGKPWWWALLAGIPLVSLVAVVYLLIVPPKEIEVWL